MSFSSTSGSVSLEVYNKIATITFGHPASNSFPAALLQKLTEALHAVSNRADINVVVLRSDGENTFCAGASFEELLSVDNSQKGTNFFMGFANVINAMRKCNKTIVGRVQGKAVGGGVGLAAACDYVFAANKASVKLSEIAIGIGPFVIEPAVSRKIGKNAMMKMTLNPTSWFSASWAAECGLYSEVFDSISNLDVALNNFTVKLSNYSQEAMFDLKKVYWENTDHWETLLQERAAISGKLVLSLESKNALKALKK